MRLRFGFASVALLASSGAIAADLLPLTRGIYVREGVRCRGASNADTMSYWGGRNGLNVSRAECTIRRFDRRGSVFTLDRRCRELHSGGSFSNRIRISITGRNAFTLLPPSAAGGRRYLYCGPRVRLR